MIEYLPLILAALSIVGSVLTFLFTANQREAKRALDKASAAYQIGESYSSLVVALQAQIDDLQEGQITLRKELEEERNKRKILEREIDTERKARIAAEKAVAELTNRVSILEREKQALKEENARLKKG